MRKYVGNISLDAIMRLFSEKLKGKQDIVEELTAEETQAMWDAISGEKDSAEEIGVGITVDATVPFAYNVPETSYTVNLLDESGNVLETRSIGRVFDPEEEEMMDSPYVEQCTFMDNVEFNTTYSVEVIGNSKTVHVGEIYIDLNDGVNSATVALNKDMDYGGVGYGNINERYVPPFILFRLGPDFANLKMEIHDENDLNTGTFVYTDAAGRAEIRNPNTGTSMSVYFMDVVGEVHSTSLFTVESNNEVLITYDFNNNVLKHVITVAVGSLGETLEGEEVEGEVIGGEVVEGVEEG